jgi:anti-sigma factor RsiW
MRESDMPESGHDQHAAFEADFSDYYERTLGEPRARELEAHLSGCQRCQDEYSRFRQAVDAVSGLHRLSAPKHFDEQVAETIHRRSAGRFFGRRAFGDRIPFEILAVLCLAIVLAVFLLVRLSSTGSVHEPLDRHPPAPDGEGVKTVVPVP